MRTGHVPAGYEMPYLFDWPPYACIDREGELHPSHAWGLAFQGDGRVSPHCRICRIYKDAHDRYCFPHQDP